MKWGNLWKVLKVIAENAPMIIAAIHAAKDKDQAPEPPRPGRA
jgi:hypothetical protein